MSLHTIRNTSEAQTHKDTHAGQVTILRFCKISVLCERVGVRLNVAAWLDFSNLVTLVSGAAEAA